MILRSLLAGVAATALAWYYMGGWLGVVFALGTAAYLLLWERKGAFYVRTNRTLKAKLCDVFEVYFDPQNYPTLNPYCCGDLVVHSKGDSVCEFSVTDSVLSGCCGLRSNVRLRYVIRLDESHVNHRRVLVEAWGPLGVLATGEWAVSCSLDPKKSGECLLVEEYRGTCPWIMGFVTTKSAQNAHQKIVENLERIASKRGEGSNRHAWDSSPLLS